MFRILLLLFPCAILAPAVSNRNPRFSPEPADGAVKGYEIQGANCILIQDFNSTGNALGGSYVPDCRKSSLFPKNI
ncbi:putative lipoprotein [Neisseria meningitidis NM151]|nr:putative lipoprotein [Neisseria meningitidis NM151]